MDARSNYFPYHRADRYPRSLVTDWRRAKPQTLKKYADCFELNLRPDLTPGETAIAVARHFESHLEVDEDEVLGRFMNAARRVPPPAAAAEVSLGKRTATRRAGAGAGAGAGAAAALAPPTSAL